MARLVSSKSQLSGSVRLPGSKSHTIRALLFAALARGESLIRRPLRGLDAQSAAACYGALGAHVDTAHSDWRVRGFAGRPNVPGNVIDVGNSGTTLRMALGTASLIANGTTVLTGDDQIRRRPAGPLLASLSDLGAEAYGTRSNDLAPYVVRGPLKGGQTTIEAVSSQYLSSLLCCCPFAEGDSTISVSLLNERPYVQITLWWLDRMGLTYEQDEFDEFRIPGGQAIDAFECHVPADFSSATFFLCAAALAGKEVKLVGLDMTDTQGDKAVIDYLKAMGARIEIRPDAIVVERGRLHGAEFSLNATPDALPAMAVTACFADGPTRLYNVPQARLKETDRIAVMTKELGRLGADVDELPDGIVVRPSIIRGGEVDGHGDHRVVMALALAGLMTDDPVTVTGSEAAAVTFPDFPDLMTTLGAAVREV